MAKHSISEAARLTGKSRSTIHRHIKSGKLAKEPGAEGTPVIDTAELHRVYGDLSHSHTPTHVPERQPDTPSDRDLLQELEALRRENDSLRADRDRWANHADSLTRLLADHRPSSGSRGGLLARLFGR